MPLNFLKIKLERRILFIVLVFLLSHCHCKSLFGIGTRIPGDKLLLKDLLRLRPGGIDETPMIGFNYAIPEPINCIEFESEENVLAEVYLKYRQNLILGRITAINSTETNIPVQIKIYGFSQEMLDVNISYILNKDISFAGKLEPQSDTLLKFEEEETTESDEDEYFDDLNGSDKIFEMGKRQLGDYLIYETYETSLDSTEEPTNHSVVFYFIDSNYITYIRFTIFDHAADKTTKDYNSSVAEYSYLTPNTFKAVIIDKETTNLFVQMLIYGYRQVDLPASYEAYIAKHCVNEANITCPIYFLMLFLLVTLFCIHTC